MNLYVYILYVTEMMIYFYTQLFLLPFEFSYPSISFIFFLYNIYIIDLVFLFSPIIIF